MEESAYRILKENIGSHWWNTGKDEIIMDLIMSMIIPRDGNVVDVGTGTGDFLSKLNFAHRFGIDNHMYEGPDGGFKFICADINRLPLKEKSVDLLLLIDVLEHMQDDRKIMEDCIKALKTNGKALIFVPALQILWSDLDKMGMHFRRYDAGKFKKMMSNISIPHRIIRSSYVNFFLFPFIFAIRIAQAIIKRVWTEMPTHNLKQPNALTNNFLRYLFGSERYFLRVMNFPIGVSYLCIVERI